MIFSRDRAAQLDLLLRSIARHAAGLYSSVTVLYTASSADYLRGYQRLYSEHDVELSLEHDFRGQVQLWLARAGRIVSLLVDDDVFYRDVPGWVADEGEGDTLPPLLPLSLRGGDYDYPFSVDGNIYRCDEVRLLLAGAAYRNPNELEHAGHLQRARLPFREVHPVEPPCLVGVPANRVSSSSGMPHMGVDPRELNRLYLGGGRLELEHDGSPIPSAHAPLRYLVDGQPVRGRTIQ